MGQYLQFLVLVGVAVQLIGITSYIKETIKGKTKPNRVTWLLWSIAPMIAAFAALSDGVKLSVLPVFMSGFGPFLVFIFSFVNKKSYWKLGKFDYLCGILSVLALALWGITNNPNIAIIFAILSDGLAAVPTLTKAWHYPETETASPFMAGLFSASTSLFAIIKWNFSSLAFPIYLILVNCILIFTIIRFRFLPKNKSKEK